MELILSTQNKPFKHHDSNYNVDNVSDNVSLVVSEEEGEEESADIGCCWHQSRERGPPKAAIITSNQLHDVFVNEERVSLIFQVPSIERSSLSGILLMLESVLHRESREVLGLFSARPWCASEEKQWMSSRFRWWQWFLRRSGSWTDCCWENWRQGLQKALSIGHSLDSPWFSMTFFYVSPFGAWILSLTMSKLSEINSCVWEVLANFWNLLPFWFYF